jgi:hypothetical protein
VRDHGEEMAQKGMMSGEVIIRKLTDGELSAYFDLIGRKYVLDGTEYNEEAPFVCAVTQKLFQ